MAAPVPVVGPNQIILQDGIGVICPAGFICAKDPTMTDQSGNMIQNPAYHVAHNVSYHYPVNGPYFQLSLHPTDLPYKECHLKCMVIQMLMVLSP